MILHHFRWYRRGYCPDFGSWSCCFEKNWWWSWSQHTSDEFIDFDIKVATTHGRLSNQEILSGINNNQVEVSDSEDDESVESKSVTKPGIEGARKGI